MEDVTQIARRRKWLLIGPAVLMTGAAYLVSLKIPDRFESKTTVLVQEQRVPDSIVKSVVTEDSGARLTTMKERILSRTRLQPIVEKFNLFNGANANIEDRISRLHDAIEVKPTTPMEGTRAMQLPGFTISVKLSDAHIAQAVCSEILNMFVEEDLQSGAQQAVNIVDFVSKEVEDARKKMNDQDGKLADFKRRYLGSLPDQEAANLNLLTSVNTQMEAVTQSLDREEQNKALLESTLGQQLSAWKATRQTGTSSPAAMDVELKKKQDELAKLHEKFNDDFPNVKAKKLEIEELKKKMADADAYNKLNPPKEKEDAAVAALMIEPENIQRLRAEISVSNLAIQEKKKQQQKFSSWFRAFAGVFFAVRLDPDAHSIHRPQRRRRRAARAGRAARDHGPRRLRLGEAVRPFRQGSGDRPRRGHGKRRQPVSCPADRSPIVVPRRRRRANHGSCGRDFGGRRPPRHRRLRTLQGRSARSRLCEATRRSGGRRSRDRRGR